MLGAYGIVLPCAAQDLESRYLYGVRSTSHEVRYGIVPSFTFFLARAARQYIMVLYEQCNGALKAYRLLWRDD